MKNVFLLLLPILFLACDSPSAQEKADDTKINWISLEEAQAKNKKNPKKLILVSEPTIRYAFPHPRYSTLTHMQSTAS